MFRAPSGQPGLTPDIKETFSDSAIYSTQPGRSKPDVGGKTVQDTAEDQVYPSLHNWLIVGI